MKYFNLFSSSFAKIIIISVFSFLVSASAHNHGEFLHCLSSHVSSSTSSHEPIFYTPNESYSTILNSSIKNNRFFFSPSTPKPLVIYHLNLMNQSLNKNNSLKYTNLIGGTNNETKEMGQYI